MSCATLLHEAKQNSVKFYGVQNTYKLTNASIYYMYMKLHNSTYYMRIVTAGECGFLTP